MRCERNALNAKVDRALGVIKREALLAAEKHGQKNPDLSAVQWAKVVQKQLGDFLQAIEAEDAAGVQKELSQIGAASALALAHLVEDLT